MSSGGSRKCFYLSALIAAQCRGAVRVRRLIPFLLTPKGSRPGAHGCCASRDRPLTCVVARSLSEGVVSWSHRGAASFTCRL